MKRLLMLVVLISVLATFCSLPAYATVTKVQSKGGTGSTRCDNNGTVTTTVTCSFTTLPAVGNLIVGLCYYAGTSATAAISDNQGNSYTLRATAAPDGASPPDKVAIADGHAATSSGTFTLTCTISAGTYIVLHIYEWSGLSSTAAFDNFGSTAATTSVATSTVTSGATTNANDLMIAGFAWRGAHITPTASSGYTLGEQSLAIGTTVVGCIEDFSTLQPSNSAGAQTASIAGTQAQGFSAAIAGYSAAAITGSTYSGSVLK